MHIFLTILIAIGLIIFLLLTIALLMNTKHYVKREIIVNAPRKKIFEFLRFLENQEKFNKHAMAGPDRKKEFKGTDGTVGFIYSWSGNKEAGVGEKEIMNLEDGKKIEMEIRFVKPMTTSATIVFEFESLTDNQTKIYWSNEGVLKWPVNIMIPMMQKMVAKDMDSSLGMLKNILEK